MLKAQVVVIERVGAGYRLDPEWRGKWSSQSSHFELKVIRGVKCGKPNKNDQPAEESMGVSVADNLS
jgi:hypothetical protein